MCVAHKPHIMKTKHRFHVSYWMYLFGNVPTMVLLRVQEQRVGQLHGLHDHQVLPRGLAVAAFYLHFRNQLQTHVTGTHKQDEVKTTPNTQQPNF
jgi:hypothetical protein